jgi:hypothetical protein
MAADDEKIEPAQVTEEQQHTAVKQEHHGHHFKQIEVPTLEQEAVQDAVHIDLSWRSWVRRRRQNPFWTWPL